MPLPWCRTGTSTCRARPGQGSQSGATGSDMVATVDYHSSGGYENLRGVNPVDGVETVAMPQRDDPPSRCALRRAVRM